MIKGIQVSSAEVSTTIPEEKNNVTIDKYIDNF